MVRKAWIEELADDERAVLEAGLGVSAPSDAKQAIWSALTTKLSAATAAGGVATASGITAWSLLKPLAVGLALGTATATGVVGYRSFAGTAPPLSSARAPNRGPVASSARGQTVHTPELVRPRETPLAETHAPRTTSEPAPTTEPSAALEPAVPVSPSVASFPSEAPATARESVLVAESRGVAAARAALRAGDPRAVLIELTALDRTSPNGMLVQERDALRIEALAALGDREAARALARRFLARYPQSPHAPAVARALR